jgi:CRISPR-associated exonuclease Cas4
LPASSGIWINIAGYYYRHSLDYPIIPIKSAKEIEFFTQVAYISIFFLLIGLILFKVATRRKWQAGIPAGRLIYSDTNQYWKVEKPLFDPALRLTGKPDYLVKQGNQVIPIEIKSRSSPRAPYDSHIYQLAAYCLLVQHEYGNRPNYGIIHYRNQTFAIDFTPTLEETIKAILREMQDKTILSHVDRSHNNPRNCQNCGYRSICDQSLRI